MKKIISTVNDPIGGRIWCALFCCGVIALLGGCAERKVHAFPWATAAVVRPNPPVARDPGAAVAPDFAPDFRVEAPANNSRIFPARSAPLRPRTAGVSPSENTAIEKSPQLVPELSPQETAAAKEQFAESAGIVQRNLAAARGKNLNAAQADVVSKVHGFLAEAREAGGEGDWGRARNLARKAQILSEDLVSSF